MWGEGKKEGERNNAHTETTPGSVWSFCASIRRLKIFLKDKDPSGRDLKKKNNNTFLKHVKKKQFSAVKWLQENLKGT